MIKEVNGIHRSKPNSPWRASLTLVLGFCAGLGSACAVAVVEDSREPATAGVEAPLDVLAAEPKPLCVEPPDPAIEPAADDLAVPAPEPSDSAGVTGETVTFASGRVADGVDVILQLDTLDAQRLAPSVQTRRGSLELTIQRAPISQRSLSGRTVLTSGGRTLADVDLVAHYVTRTSSSAGTVIGVNSLKVVDRSTGAVLDQHSPFTITATPGTCEERGIVRFGPFPIGMPAVNFPDIQGCNDERCARVAESWVRLTHNAWRARQLFSVLENMHPVSRSYFWDKPGTDGDGVEQSLRTSPAWFFGNFSKGRYETALEVIKKLRKLTKTAKTGSTKLRLVCPVQSENPGNVCFTVKPLAHHSVKGWVNFCDDAFSTTRFCDDDPANLDESMHHEPLHHVFAGATLMHDRVLHGHGNTCLSDLKSKLIYCEAQGNGGQNVRHFASYGNSCNHLDKLSTVIDAYATFVRSIGNQVRAGTLVKWPRPTPPTPTPPDCYSDEGCRCDPIGPPDGDGAVDQSCGDFDGEMTCQKTLFGTENVGICTKCDAVRGPGCACNDLDAPCDVGFCWGDDTRGNATGTGTCYRDPPPAWGCLADCERLLGEGAFCLHDNPGKARCVPVGTTHVEGITCWEGGGHMDPNTLTCTHVEECTTNQQCRDLGYPEYFSCDQSLRCVPTP